MDPVRDLVLFVVTPAIILPIAALLLLFTTNPTFVLLVAAFGQVGHNLPGLIRAYGDRELFRRYRFRFVVAPVLLGIACLAAAIQHLHVLILVSVSWAIWHALMQTYGFLRIYSARSKSPSKLDQRLDLGMCLLWFGGAMLLNDEPLLLILNRWYQCGGFGISAAFIESCQSIWLFALIGVTVCWVFQQIAAFKSNVQSASIKLLLTLTSISFYWFAYVGCESILVGAAMFEIFHDVQYLTIVWLFNRRRVEQRANVGSFVSFVFRCTGRLICRIGLRLRKHTLDRKQPVLGNDQVSADGVPGDFRVAAFLLRWFHLEDSRISESSVVGNSHRSETRQEHGMPLRCCVSEMNFDFAATQITRKGIERLPYPKGSIDQYSIADLDYLERVAQQSPAVAQRTLG